MFIPNTYCLKYPRSDTQDVYSNYSYGPAVRMACSVTALDLKVSTTSVRADSSASRGRAEEEIGSARILFPKTAIIREGDIVQVEDEYIECTRIFPRRNVLGRIDHIQVDFRKGVNPNG